jgi:hypothetical protein
VEVAEITAGVSHTCARLTDGTVQCWGDNLFGKLGNGTYTGADTPQTVLGLSTAVEITAGLLHTCARLTDGTVQCWGAGGTHTGTTPQTVSGLSTAVEITAGFGHTCARLTDGTVQCWGNNVFGQLGNGTPAGAYTPQTVSGLSTAVEITAGVFHTCARLTDGTVQCWGDNDFGQLGNGTYTGADTPQTVLGLSTAVEITAGDSYTCARLTDGTVQCWGDNSSGQLGNGTYTGATTPQTVIFPGTDGTPTPTPVLTNGTPTPTPVLTNIPGLDIQAPVLSATLTTPPASPALGNRYLLIGPLSGGWAGYENSIATWNGTAWDYAWPTTGMLVVAGGQSFLYVGGQWVPLNWQGSVLDKDLTAPPSAVPAVGAAYLLPAGASGAWAGQGGKIATWNGSMWVFTTPTDGMASLVTDEGRVYVHQGGQWSTPQILCNGLVVTKLGTSGNDINLLGTPGNDVIHGLGGDDTIKGLRGNDIICGGAGNDVLRGGKGKDQLYGEAGNDKLYGDQQNDRLDGGSESNGKKGKDRCNGGPGRDRAKKCETKVNIP